MEAPQDGLIDFSSYSLQQLHDLQFAIDRQAFPQNYQRLIEAIADRESRKGLAEEETEAPGGRFTTRTGVLGWLEAKRRRSSVYGVGSIEILATGVMLRGLERTWLGIAQQAEVFVAFESIGNVVRDGTLVRFDYRRRMQLSARIEYRAVTIEGAARLASALPQTQNSGFVKRWSELRDFNRRAERICCRAWVTPSLTFLNIAIFIAMATQTRGQNGFTPDLLLRWGANYAPLTVNGQWWRLLTATFLHANLVHLLLNMWALWNIGRLSERLYGSRTVLALYLTTGVLASFSSVVWNPTRSTIGASGAIFGLFGIFLAFLWHRRAEVPRTLLRSHRLSTIIFVLFNLISGARQTDVDNAAHVGGLASGLLLGWIMARSMDPEVRARFPATRALGAASVTAMILAWAVWFSTGVGSQLTAPERFVRTHEWFVSGEVRNLQRWQELAAQSAAGTISDAQFGRLFQSDVQPFWQGVAARLQKEGRSAGADGQAYELLITDYVRQRVELSQAIIDATVNNKAGSLDSVKSLTHELDLAQARLVRVQLRATFDHRPRALANSAWVARFRNLISLRRPKCVAGPQYGPGVADSDLRTDGPAEGAAAGCLAQRLFLAGDYEALEQLMTREAAHLGDLPDGGSSLAATAHGLDTLFMYGGLSINDLLGRTADWRRAVRNPVNADLIEVKIFEAWGWGARGNGGAAEVSAQAWLAFAQRVEMAAAGLNEIQAQAQDNPLWYEVSEDVGLDKSIGLVQIKAIFSSGVAKFPKYTPLYRGMLRALMPRWFGSFDQVAEFINGQTVTAAGARNYELYARLYAIYGGMEDTQANIFKDVSADWVTMRSGFKGLVESHSSSDAILNSYARYACVAEDMDTFGELDLKLDKRISASVWSNTVTPPSCRGKLVDFHIERARDRLQDGSFDDTLTEANRALAVDPKSAAALAYRGIARVWRSEYLQAHADFDAAAAIDPRQVLVFRGRGIEALRQGRYDAAIEAFTRSQELEPDEVTRQMLNTAVAQQNLPQKIADRTASP